jgi:hypothetical protein
MLSVTAISGNCNRVVGHTHDQNCPQELLQTFLPKESLDVVVATLSTRIIFPHCQMQHMRGAG